MSKQPFHPQLPLGLGLREHTLFANFFAGGNVQLVDQLTESSVSIDGASAPCVFVWGANGVGKTHLLQAVCHAAGAAGHPAVYLPLRESDRIPLGVLAGMEQLRAICVDDVDAIAGQPQWEEALFALFERCHQQRSLLVATSQQRPTELGLDPSLASRFSWGLGFHLKPLSDPDKRRALQLRAHGRGLRLADDAARLLVRRCASDMSELVSRFDQLDQASMASKRRLSVSFIREVFGWQEVD